VPLLFFALTSGHRCVPRLLLQDGIFLSFSPRYVVLSGWTGDLDGTWDGFAEGMQRLKHSADAGYGGPRPCFNVAPPSLHVFPFDV
jgi:hypothetical protein